MVHSIISTINLTKVDILFVAFGLSIAFLFMYRIEALTDNGTRVIMVLLYTLVLFGASFIFSKLGIGKPNMVSLLRMPLVSLGIFKLFQFVFEANFKRSPENTFWVFTSKSVYDVLFTVLFWIFGVGLPVLIVML